MYGFTKFALGLLLVLAVEMTGGRPIPAQAIQGHDVDTQASLDERLLHDIYTADNRTFRGAMRVANATAYPVFYGGPIAAWGGVGVVRGGGDWEDAYRLTVAAALTFGGVIGVKYIVQRPRPFVVLPNVVSRAADSGRGLLQKDPYAFPSGHAAMAATLAVSWSLSHPQWYVIAPSMVWASSVALSRIWLGVHYPSDVLAGIALGTAVAIGVHLLGPHITPGVLKEGSGRPATAVLRLPF